MKKYEFNLNAGNCDVFFPLHLIKTKVEILEVLMEATRYILTEPLNNKETERSQGKIILVIDKMSRLFFCRENKSYSIIFPFTVKDRSNGLDFTFQKNGINIEIDHELISNFMSIIKSDTFHSNSSLDFANDIDELESNYNENFWILMKSLLLMEDGYIRYDTDSTGYEEAKKKGKEHTHPLHHLDIFYTSNATFKLGLDNHISETEFIDYIDIKTDCKYLRKPL